MYIPRNCVTTSFNTPIALGERRQSCRLMQHQILRKSLTAISGFTRFAPPLHPSTYAKRKASNVEFTNCTPHASQPLCCTSVLYFATVLKRFFFTFRPIHRSQDSSAGIVNTVRVGQSRNSGSNPGSSKFSSSTYRPHWLWGPHRPLSMGMGGGRFLVR